jgi:hypothetical protein
MNTRLNLQALTKRSVENPVEQNDAIRLIEK